MAREDPSPLVRLYLAGGLQRLPVDSRWDVLTGLFAHAEDAGDQNLPLMIWYAAEPAVGLDMERAIAAAGDSKLPNLFAFTVRRVAAVGTQGALKVLTDRLGQTTDRDQQKELAAAIGRVVDGQ
jgi:hypothetical protein